MQIAILGRQPHISLAELEALFGPEKIKPFSDYAALVDTDDPLPQLKLGGSIKSAKLLTRLENTDLADAFLYLQKIIPEHLQYLPEGKLQLGVSVYGDQAQKDWLLRHMLTLKKIIKKSGRGVRIIENKTEALEAAVVLYNKLTGPLGWEFLLIRDGSDIVLAQTTGVQNIDDYSKRDFGRPNRDAKNGMLPPKLAQIMLNLAVPDPTKLNGYLLDPFCGTGVIRNEAELMGFNFQICSDINQTMIEHTITNMKWLSTSGQLKKHSEFIDTSKPGHTSYAAVDATTANWLEFIASDSKLEIGSVGPKNISAVVCEAYLGKPLTSLPPKPELENIMQEADAIASGFLKNIASQIASGTKLCIALPAWRTASGEFLHLKMLDHLSDLGYNRLEFKHASKADLIYHRKDQIVARELVVLEKQ